MNGALDGIRVLDLCIILAGPTCGRTLAEYGADVIKIDPEHRKPSLTPWLDVGRGKRSVCLNIRNDAGLEAFLRLADAADVILTGFRKGVAERLGIGYERLAARNPRIVYASINAFGQEGAWASRPGFDQNAQAATGMQVRNGGDGQPAPPPYTFNDYGTGLMAAYGVIMALLERERTGKGQKVDTALAYTASTFSSAHMIDFEGYEPDDVIAGPSAKGSGDMSRLYQTSDGWIALSADGGRDRLAALPQFAGADGVAGLEAAFRSRPSAEWVETLNRAGLPTVEARGLQDARTAARTRDGDSGLVVSRNHPAFGVVEHGGTPQRLSATPALTPDAPIFSADTEGVIRELGYDTAQIEAMRDEGTIPQAAGGIALN